MSTLLSPAYREGQAAYFAGITWGLNPYGPVATFNTEREPTNCHLWDQGWHDAKALPWWTKLARRFTRDGNNGH